MIIHLQAQNDTSWCGMKALEGEHQLTELEDVVDCPLCLIAWRRKVTELQEILARFTQDQKNSDYEQYYSAAHVTFSKDFADATFK